MPIPTKMTQSQAGRLGAEALNKNPAVKRAAALKGAQTKLRANPNFFVEIGLLGSKKKKQGGGVNAKD